TYNEPSFARLSETAFQKEITTLRERRSQQCGISYFHAHYRRNRKVKSRITKNIANGWTISTGQGGCSFPDRLPIAPMESISCSPQARAKRSASRLKTRITSEAFEVWKCWNGTPIAPFG